jgi:hypothetical protein
MDKDELKALNDLIKTLSKIGDVSIIDTSKDEEEIIEELAKEKNAQVNIMQHITDCELRNANYDAIDALKSMFKTIDMSWEMTKMMKEDDLKDEGAKAAAFFYCVGDKVMEAVGAVYNHKKSKNTANAHVFAMDYLQDKIKKELN